MTPHEVIKNSISQEMLASYFHSDDIDIGDIGEYVKNNNLSLLLSVKEMVESKKRDNVFVPDHTPSMHGGLVCRDCGGQEDCKCEAYNEALSDLQSLLDEEINKVKEL